MDAIEIASKEPDTPARAEKLKELDTKRKFYNNRRVRVYTRLRKLGYYASSYKGTEAVIEPPEIIGT